LSNAESRPAARSSLVKTGAEISGGMPAPSKLVPLEVSNTSFGKPKLHPFGRSRQRISEEIPLRPAVGSQGWTLVASLRQVNPKMLGIVLVFWKDKRGNRPDPGCLVGYRTLE